MKNKFVSVLTLVSISTVNTHLSTVFAQGNLTPPGAPAPTMKTLDQIDAKLEKRTAITNLPYFIGSSGSYYLATNLTGAAGLHGLEIAGQNVTVDLNGFSLSGVSNALRGVHVGSGTRNVVVRNGSIIGWGGDGVGVFDNLSTVRLENLQLRNNGGSGIRLFDKSQVVDCRATGNSAHGIQVGGGCQINRCLVAGNGANGIFTDAECQVTDSLAKDNGGNGINIGFRSVVRDCTSTGNTMDGIRVLTQCGVFNNLCAGNGNGGDGAGIHATGNNNRIESNQVMDNDRGIDVDAGGNLVIKNSSSGNSTHYDIAGGNSVGPIAIAGSDMWSVTNATHPFANFTH